MTNRGRHIRYEAAAYLMDEQGNLLEEGVLGGDMSTTGHDFPDNKVKFRWRSLRIGESRTFRLRIAVTGHYTTFGTRRLIICVTSESVQISEPQQGSDCEVSKRDSSSGAGTGFEGKQ